MYSLQSITKLMEAEVLLNQGMAVCLATRQLENNERTYYRWRKEYREWETTQVGKAEQKVM